MTNVASVTLTDDTKRRSPFGGQRGPGGSERALTLAINVVRIGPVLILVLAGVLLTCLSPVFLTTANLQNLGVQASMVGILAVGQLLVILTKGVDLSVGSVIGVSGVIGVQLAIHGAPAAVVLLAMVGAGVVVGVVNGFLLIS